MSKYARLNVRGLQTLQRNLDKNVQAGLVRLAQSVAKEAQNRAPKDTGALAESIHVVTSSMSDYTASMGEAQSLFEAAKIAGHTPKGRIVSAKAQFMAQGETRPAGDDEVWVVVGMTYGLFVELGTRHMAAQPFLIPAVLSHQDRVAPFFKDTLNTPSIEVGVTTP